MSLRTPHACTIAVEGEDAPHPDAIRMAEVMREMKEAHGACLYKDMTRAGFTPAQITEHFPQAQRLADAASTVQVTTDRVDRCADVLFKARSPMPNRPPMMAGVDEQALRSAWGDYCQSRSALRLDPWSGQRERALAKLERCLWMLPIHQAERARIMHETGRILANTPQGSLFATRKAADKQVHA
ncbi:hypothetical protein JYU29_05825 [Tianweitania sp. BSSL-BM11]|uniref:DUF305 domain-containing protein n=1 Tax=Tianweitania aestuarii TaxID=2814886 RepID=A0ABS5RT23_9HYPH|nr:hypothetical protein [Tianweitania aestuarii]MBS9720205.1 hypothetical protein [Tianweitania aestuarii]